MTIWVDVDGWEEGWRRLEKAGQGGHGVAWRAENVKSGQIACLKVLTNKKDKDRRVRCFREATAYETFNHPGIPRLVESNALHYADANRALYLVTEFIPGPTLTKVVEGGGPISLSDASAVTDRLLDILFHLHNEQGWVHRDIKPDNIILRDGVMADPVLLDFGLGYKDGIAPDFSTEHGQELGNRFLRLPDLAPGSPLRQDVRTDLAFAGGILYYLLTGLSPSTLLDAEGNMPHQRQASFEALRNAAGRNLIHLLSFFDRAFATKLSGRFSSAAEMRAALQNILDGDISMSGNSESDLAAIRASLQSAANRDLANQKQLYDRAMGEISAIHYEILREVSPTYRSYAGGHVNFVEGLRNTLGFAHFATHDRRYAPEFLINAVGNDLVITVDGEPFFRTDVDEPVFTDKFREEVRGLFLSGLRELIESENQPAQLTIAIEATDVSRGQQPKILVRITDPQGDHRTRWEVDLVNPLGQHFKQAAFWPGSGKIFRSRTNVSGSRVGKWSVTATRNGTDVHNVQQEIDKD